MRRNAEARPAFLDVHGALTAEEVADFAESSAGNRRQTAHRWASDRRIFAVAHRGQTLYPGFQFGAGTRQPRSGVKTALERLPAGMTGWALALWRDTPVLDGEEWVSPLDLVDDPERLARVADGSGWLAPRRRCVTAPLVWPAGRGRDRRRGDHLPPTSRR